MAGIDITATHPQYQLHLDEWTRCRDVMAGSDAVKAKRTKYLPLLEGQPNEEDVGYKGYIARAMFFGAMERTIAGLIGSVLRKPPVIIAPTSLEPFLDDLLLTQDTFMGALVYLLEQVFATGRCGIFIDWNDEHGRPYWADYPPEDIINWHVERFDGERVLTWLVLRERVQQPPGVRTVGEEMRYREFRLTETGVTVTEWTRGATDKDYLPGQSIAMMRRGVALERIPFICLGPKRVTMDVAKPPLLDLADINLSHYRTSADLEHGRHFTALPTPYVTGWMGNADGSPLRIGSGTAWIIPAELAKVGMLEFTGQGLTSLRDALKDKETLMAVVGARLLEQQPRGVETAEAVRLRQSGEQSALGTMVATVSTGLTLALQWFAWWLGQDVIGKNKTVAIELSRDFFDARINGQDAQALMALWQAKGISYETLYWNLQQGEWARPGVTWEEEQQQIEDEDLIDDTSEIPQEPVPPPPGAEDDPEADVEPPDSNVDPTTE